MNQVAAAQQQSGSSWRSAFYQGVRAVIRLLLFLLTDFEVHGQEHIPDTGPLLITPNHISAVDLAAAMAAIPHETAVFAADKHRERFVGVVLRRFEVIFVRRGTADRQALRKALRILENGGILGVAPEGTRGSGKKMIRGKPGAAFLALRSKAPVLPVGLTGTETVLRDWFHLRRPKIRVNIGQPYKIETPGDGKPDLQDLADHMMLRIAELLPPDYWGVYADRAGIVTEERQNL